VSADDLDSASGAEDTDAPTLNVDDPAALVGVGAAILDRYFLLSNFPERDGGAFIQRRVTRFGGAVANVLVGATRLGRETGMVTRLGEDEDGDRILDNLREEGVTVARVARGPERSTYCHVLRAEDTRTILTGGRATDELRLDDADRAYVRGAEAAFTTLYTPDPVLRELAAAADETALVVDLATTPGELTGHGANPDTTEALLDRAGCVVGSAPVVAAHLGCAPDEAAAALRERVPRGAVTRGADGATLFDADGAVEVPAFPVEATDPTGAGDAFIAALLDRWVLGGESAAAAGRAASAAGAMNCRELGARGHLPTTGELEAFLAEHE